MLKYTIQAEATPKHSVKIKPVALVVVDVLKVSGRQSIKKCILVLRLIVHASQVNQFSSNYEHGCH